MFLRSQKAGHRKGNFSSLSSEKNLLYQKREYILPKQLIRSATSIGANIAESRHGCSRADFKNKLLISLKEAEETKYWLKLLKETSFINTDDSDALINTCNQLIKMLMSSINTLNKKITDYGQNYSK